MRCRLVALYEENVGFSFIPQQLLLLSIKMEDQERHLNQFHTDLYDITSLHLVINTSPMLTFLQASSRTLACLFLGSADNKPKRFHAKQSPACGKPGVSGELLERKKTTPPIAGRRRKAPGPVGFWFEATDATNKQACTTSAESVYFI